ncbi:MAG: VPS10 domain-containing protein [Chitinophagaceae bacterium]
MKQLLFIFCLLIIAQSIFAQEEKLPNKRAEKTNIKTNKDSIQLDTVLHNGMKWRCIGPYRGGRSLAVCGVAGDAMTYYAGACGGGVWKTTDGGNTWNSISDSVFQSSSVGAIAVAHSNPNVVYAGMGEVEMRGNISFGDGVYKSIDAGKTWKHVGLTETDAIGTIVINPQNPDLVYAAAQGKIWGPTPNKERGLFRSKDGGKTWDKILYVDDTTGCVDVKMDATNPAILYASMWKAWRTPYSLSSGGKGSGLYKSTDGGDTWKLISENPGMPKGLKGKIICTVSSINDNKLWAIVENEQYGVYYSEDAGDTWKRISTMNDLTQRPWYFSQIFADTKSDNIVYVLNVEFWKSIDGGATWNRISNQHGDNHDMWINPDNDNNWIMGDDGGPEITFDGGKNFTREHLATAQFYHVNLDNDFPYNVYGPQQDDGSIKIKSRTAGSVISNKDWHSVAGGEAGYIVPDPTNSKITYGGEYDGIMSTFNENDDQYRFISVYPEQNYGIGAEKYKYRFQWTFPIAFSPHNSKCLYATSNIVHRSLDAGQTWENISPDLTRHDPKTLKPSGGPITLDITGTETYATIFAFAESPVTAGVLWAGSDDGYVNVSTDNGKTWTNVTPKILPDWALISYVEPSHFDAAVCYVSATRYKSGDHKPYILKTEDYGKTWRMITNGLNNNIYNRCVREDPTHKGILYAGMETGIMISFDDGAHWQSLQFNLPNTPVHDIQVQPREHDLVIATHGRSFWILDDITSLYQMAEAKNSRAYLFKPRDTYRFPGGGGDDEVENPQDGQNPPNGVLLRYYLRTKPDKEVKLSFYTTNGDSIITYSGVKDNKGKMVPIPKDFYENKKLRPSGLLKTDAGINTFVWDMRYPDAKGDTSATFEASLQGPKLIPGTYKVKLLIGDSVVMEQPVTVITDPRNPATVADLKEQFDLNAKICKKLNELSKGTAQIKQVKNQINNFIGNITDSATAKPFKEKGKIIVDSLEAVKNELFNEKIQANEDNLRFPLKLEEKLATMNYLLQASDTKPTASMYDVYNNLSAQIDAQLQKLKNIIDTKIPEFNKLAGSIQKPPVDVNVKENLDEE